MAIGNVILMHDLLSLTLSHGYSNNEIKHRNREKRLEETSEYGKKNSEHENRFQHGLPSPGDRYTP